jgi:hypothetical protein
MWLWCTVENSYENQWVWVRIDGTQTYGWIWNEDLDASSDPDQPQRLVPRRAERRRHRALPEPLTTRQDQGRTAR